MFAPRAAAAAASALPSTTGRPNEMPEGSKFKRLAAGAGEGAVVRGSSSSRQWPRGVQSIYRHVHSLQVCAAVATPAGMAVAGAGAGAALRHGH